MKHRMFRSAPALLLLAATISILGASRLAAQGPGIPKTLTIEQAVQLALDRNPGILLAQSRVNTGSARINGAFGAFLPQINVSAGYSKQLDAGATVIQGIPIAIDRPAYNLDANASANLVLFDGFSRSANYSSARNEFDAAMRSLERVRQDVTQQVRATFLNALRAEQLVEIRRTDLELSRERLAQERERVAVGAGLMMTVYNQESEVANSELAIEQARTDVIMARNTLSLLLSYDPAAEIQLSSEGLANSIDSAEMAETRRSLGTAGEMLERQSRSRTDVFAARLKLESASNLVAAARGGYYPTVSAGLGWNWQKAGDATSSTATTFSLNLQYSPFDGFRTSEQVQIAEAQRQSAELELRKLELDVRSELEQALARLDGAERQVRAAEKAVQAARQTRFAADERYRAGAGAYTDFLLANAQYLNAQVNQVNAVFNYRMALYEVRYLIGE